MTENPPYTFVFLRHGESTGNAEARFQGQAEFPLTETGFSQARALAERWRSEQVTFDQIVSSPLLRARQTAEIVAEALKVPLEFDPLWMEWNNGILAGLTREEARRTYPRPDFVHPYMPLGRDGESHWELYLRGGQAVQSLLDRPVGKYLIVSHGAILNMVLYAILGIALHADFQGPAFQFRNTAYTTVTYDPLRNRWQMLGLNERPHWNIPDAEDM